MLGPHTLLLALPGLLFLGSGEFCGAVPHDIPCQQASPPHVSLGISPQMVGEGPASGSKVSGMDGFGCHGAGGGVRLSLELCFESHWLDSEPFPDSSKAVGTRLYPPQSLVLCTLLTLEETRGGCRVLIQPVCLPSRHVPGMHKV